MVQVGEDLGTPAGEGPAERGDLGNGAAGHRGQQPVELSVSGLEAVGGVRPAQLLGGDPGDRYLSVRVAEVEAGPQPPPSGVGQGLGTAAQHRRRR